MKKDFKTFSGLKQASRYISLLTRFNMDEFIPPPSPMGLGIYWQEYVLRYSSSTYRGSLSSSWHAACLVPFCVPTLFGFSLFFFFCSVFGSGLLYPTIPTVKRTRVVFSVTSLS